ncbi:MAG TPA: amidohydrolase family protein, partial [Terriglobales bacterium]|nr:amidohydrolase family protein [Terriglobales bacterium]
MTAGKGKQSARPLLLANIGQLLTLRAPGKDTGPRRAHELNDVGIVEDAAVLCDGGKILAAGKARDVLRYPGRKKLKSVEEIDCQNKVVLPGFVDSHTHLIFAVPRLVDFEKRISGASYEEIAQAGGGIRSSADAVRKASTKTLVQLALAALQEMA